MRRVIYAWNYVEWGGAQIHFLALIREARKSFETVVVLPKGTDRQFLGFLKAENIPYEEFEAAVDLKPASGILDKFRRHWSHIKSDYQMLRKIEEVGLEDSIVHTDILPTGSLTALIWLSIRAQVFITSHNALPPVSHWRLLLWKLKFRTISLFDSFHVFCTNEHAAAYFRKLYTGRVADEIKITYDSINPLEIDEVLSEPFDRAEALSRFGIAVDKFVILAVGQFIDRKGRWTFLEAAQQIAAESADVIFVWVMPQLPGKADMTRIETFGLNDRFRMIRSEDIGLERRDILCFFRVADVYALPSLVEGLPISLLEAMSLHIPCISTNVYGIPEAIINEQTGLLIEPNNSRDLADAITRFKFDPELRHRLAHAGRDHVTTRFDERIAAQTAVTAYRSVS
jgi:glycosyltransferase involved in cell wall biosynthesis